MPFTDSEQQGHRAAFIHDCRQKAWGAACHAAWIGKQLDGLIGEHQKLVEEDRALEVEITKLEVALDYHSVANRANRDKRTELQERRNGLVPVQNKLAENIRQGQQAMQNLLTSVDSNLELAAHAEGWGWPHEH